MIGVAEGNEVFSQSVLKDYYKGDSVKMLNDAQGLLNNPDPVFSSSPAIKTADGDAEQLQFFQTHKVPEVSFTMRDGKKVNAYKLASKSGNIIRFIHGVKSDTSNYLKTAWLLEKATGSTVYALDLRGQGFLAGVRGDVDYINQYADDIADIITKSKKEKPMAKPVLAGHPMGGGIVLKYLSGKYNQQVNGYILLAPLQDTTPEAMSTIIFGIKQGLKRGATPFANSVTCCSNVLMPPFPEPQITPIRFLLSFSKLILASCTASSTATRAFQNSFVLFPIGVRAAGTVIITRLNYFLIVSSFRIEFCISSISLLPVMRASCTPASIFVLTSNALLPESSR